MEQRCIIFCHVQTLRRVLKVNLTNSKMYERTSECKHSQLLLTVFFSRAGKVL